MIIRLPNPSTLYNDRTTGLLLSLFHHSNLFGYMNHTDTSSAIDYNSQNWVPFNIEGKKKGRPRFRARKCSRTRILYGSVIKKYSAEFNVLKIRERVFRNVWYRLVKAQRFNNENCVKIMNTLDETTVTSNAIIYPDLIAVAASFTSVSCFTKQIQNELTSVYTSNGVSSSLSVTSTACFYLFSNHILINYRDYEILQLRMSNKKKTVNNLLNVLSQLCYVNTVNIEVVMVCTTRIVIMLFFSFLARVLKY